MKPLICRRSEAEKSMEFFSIIQCGQYFLFAGLITEWRLILETIGLERTDIGGSELRHGAVNQVIV